MEACPNFQHREKQHPAYITQELKLFTPKDAQSSQGDSGTEGPFWAPGSAMGMDDAACSGGKALITETKRAIVNSFGILTMPNCS